MQNTVGNLEAPIFFQNFHELAEKLLKEMFRE